MTSDFRDPNPYATPTFSGIAGPELQHRVRGRVMAPAIGLMVVSLLGLALSIFNVAYAFTKHEIDPNQPEILQAMQKGAEGTQAAIIQSCFIALNLLILAGAIQMMRFRTWGMALAASILAMLNFGSFCCVPGIPVGIWSMVILLTPEVRNAFQAVNAQSGGPLR